MKALKKSDPYIDKKLVQYMCGYYFDIRTFEVKARPVAKVDGLRPGMTVTVNWDEIR